MQLTDLKVSNPQFRGIEAKFSRVSQSFAQRKIVCTIWGKSCKLRAFSACGGSLQAPESGNFRENLAKVSGQFPRYSRFRETFRGDRFRTALSGKRRQRHQAEVRARTRYCLPRTIQNKTANITSPTALIFSVLRRQVPSIAS